MVRVTSGAEKVINTGLKTKVVEDLRTQQVLINELLNSTELLHYPVCMGFGHLISRSHGRQGIRRLYCQRYTRR